MPHSGYFAAGLVLVLQLLGRGRCTMLLKNGSSVWFSYHADIYCKQPMYDLLVPQEHIQGVRRPVAINTCFSSDDGRTRRKLACKVSAASYSLLERVYAASDTLCAGPVMSNSTVRHKDLCRFDFRRLGYERIHCGEDILLTQTLQTQPAVKRTLYSDNYCNTQPQPRQDFLNACTPSWVARHAGSAFKIDYYYILRQIATQPGLTRLQLLAYAADDQLCAGQPIAVRPVTLGGRGACLPDPLHPGFFFKNDPSSFPVVVHIPTTVPTPAPSARPTLTPTPIPTTVPTFTPSFSPSPSPTAIPTVIATAVPTAIQTAVPTTLPTFAPTASPSFDPTHVPTALPTLAPSPIPSHAPTVLPTFAPSVLIIIARYIRWSLTGGSTTDGSSHFCELQALTASGVNRALNLGQNGGATQCCGSPNFEIGTFQLTTDGDTGTHSFISWSSGAVGILYDLGSVYDDIAMIKTWNFYEDGRTYYNMMVEVSIDGNTWKTLYGPQDTATPPSGVVINPK